MNDIALNLAIISHSKLVTSRRTEVAPFRQVNTQLLSRLIDMISMGQDDVDDERVSLGSESSFLILDVVHDST